ncbi:uncharacterized protein LOC125818937 [Solanum verrucosum]|uniref:uncharacterized protein LOC125818937 n=1 Tax=Solanum verrucosum TaxID=315347 RepID=UPI0020D1D019|nr:uncharacterized protein LOC125818937 [Solanum verrucosum]
MANFFQDAKIKIQDLFIYIVSCGKSSNELSRNDQGTARDVPLGDKLGLQIHLPEEDQVGLATIITPIRFSKEPPRNDQEPTRDHVLEDDLGIITVFPSGEKQPINNAENQLEEENIIAQQDQELDKSKGNSQEQKEIDDDEDFEPLPKGFIIPEERANFSTPPGKRSAPRPKTG